MKGSGGIRGARGLSLLGAWALAFGCAIGWDAVSLPCMSLLPKAGPAGAILGVLAGGLVMLVIAWNFHVMINRYPGPGGVYIYASRSFGSDHGFVCAWFFCLVYVAIVWADATVISVVLRCMFGDVARFGFRYTVAGSDVCLGYILASVAAISAAAAVCCRRRLANAAQTAMALAVAAGVASCFLAALLGGPGAPAPLAPAFNPAAAGGAGPFA